MLKVNAISVGAESKTGEVTAVFFNASFGIPGQSGYSVSKNIVNVSEYEANKAQCDMDYKEFEAKAAEMAESIKLNWLGATT